MGQNNTSRDGAWEVTKTASGSVYTSGPVSNVGYTRNAQGDAFGTTFQRHAWWVYHPTAAGTATISGINTSPGSGTNVYITIFKQLSDGTLSPDNLIGYNGSHSHAVAAGDTWFYVFSQNNDTTESLYWLVMMAASPATLAPAHDSRQTPANVVIVASGNTYEAPPTPAVQLTYDTSAAQDGALYANQFRSSWYRYVPETAGSLSATANRYNSSNDIYMSIFEDAGSGLTRIANPVAQQTNTTVAVVTGKTYYVQLYQLGVNDPSTTYRLSATGPKSVSYDPDLTNHQWTNAITVTPDSSGSVRIDVDNTVARFADAESNPTSSTLTGFRAGWYKYNPVATKPGVNAASVGFTGGSAIQVFSRIGTGAWTLVGQQQRATNSYTDSVVFTVTLGTTYYFRVANTINDAGQKVRLGVDFMPTKAAVLMDAAPIRVAVAGKPARIAEKPQPVPPITVATDLVDPKAVGGNGRATAVPIAVSVTMQPMAIEVSADEVFAPPLTLAVMMGNPSIIAAGLSLTSPDAGETIATSYPQFIVALMADDPEVDYQIEIQWSADNDFTDPVSAIVDAPAVDGGIAYTPTTPVFEATFWRARLLLDGEEVIGWTPYRVFYVSAVIATVQLPITWTVDTDAARPIHLWHFDPPGVEEGDLVTAYGQGFPLSTGTLYLYNEPVLPLSWDLIEADALADPVTRTIDGAEVDPEHFAVTFIAPPVEEPGGPLTVEA